MKKGRPKKKIQDPKDVFHNKTIGEIKTSQFFKEWHQRKKPKTGQTGNIPTPEEFIDARKRGGRAAGLKSSLSKAKFPIFPQMTDTNILNQVMGYLTHLEEWRKSNITGVECKGFQKCKKKLRMFINQRRNVQAEQPEQEGDWQI